MCEILCVHMGIRWKETQSFSVMFTMELGGFALGLDLKMETATCELSPEGYMTAL